MSKQSPSLDILAFGAHPDDVEFSSAGTLIKMALAGYRTGIVDLTRGELSTNGNLETRAEETKKASAVLRLSVRENLELPDGGISSDGDALVDGVSQCSRVVEVIRKYRPAIILVPYWQERHPDHVATSRLVARAAFLSGVTRYKTTTDYEKFTPAQIIYYQMRYLFQPSFIIDISDVVEHRIEAIRCYSSQVMKDSQSVGAKSTLLNAPGALEFLESFTKHYGAFIGTAHGEPFLMPNSLRLDDPVAHFRKFPGNVSQIFPAQR